MSQIREQAGRAGARQAGFTLIETLVALSVLLSFAAVLGPLMYQTHRILSSGDGQVRAEVLLRSLLATPIDRLHPDLGLKEGDSGGLHWRVTIEPSASSALSATEEDAPALLNIKKATPADAKDAKKVQRINWSLLRVSAQVSWNNGQTLMAQTLRLARLE